ncbi:MAG: recombinase RecA [Candidatus Tagabacteria bacterium RIFCSPLOWO2_01_FULL_39_11]|uniref:Protein RecA n=1 Tax=Candidatus Tagabacteria bacterium RIFCSPLOWO2_01_FULL_39_11 TaxID=1802295 RepID=A0A1G2LR32_9BACT|nr:MAG: recombinase RecA [Candidatus Tagabacteria bacterium RIFCSPLOWO2_01_FULL_39_11]
MIKKTDVKINKVNNLENAIREIQAKYGEGSLMKLGEARRVDVDVIPTGSLWLDISLGVGGVPRGRVIEIFGHESSGKTTLALHIIAEAQKKGGLCAFIDAEHALDPEYAKKIGVEINDLLISQPDAGEQALEILESLVRSGSIDVIVVDSVAALTPRAEIEGDMGAHHVGLQARLMSQALRKLTAITAKTNTLVIFLNQIRMKIGVMFGNPETTTGGTALKFYSSVRVEVRRAAQIKKGEDVVGNRIKAKVVKNKVAPPFRTCEFDIMYNEGISYFGDVLNLGVKYDILKRLGASYAFGDVKLGRGYDSAKDFLKANPKISSDIVEQIKAKLI